MGIKFADSACDISKKLTTSRECNTRYCDDGARWIVGRWLEVWKQYFFWWWFDSENALYYSYILY